MMERRIEPARTERVLRLKKALRVRLQAVCHQLPDDEFEALIEQMANVEVKYTLRARGLVRREVSPEALRDQRLQN